MVEAVDPAVPAIEDPAVMSWLRCGVGCGGLDAPMRSGPHRTDRCHSKRDRAARCPVVPTVFLSYAPSRTPDDFAIMQAASIIGPVVLAEQAAALEAAGSFYDAGNLHFAAAQAEEWCLASAEETVSRAMLSGGVVRLWGPTLLFGWDTVRVTRCCCHTSLLT